MAHQIDVVGCNGMSRNEGKLADVIPGE